MLPQPQSNPVTDRLIRPLHSLLSDNQYEASWRAALEGPSTDGREALNSLVGYLNFSSGPAVPATMKAWNRVHDEAAGGDILSGPPPFMIIRHWLEESTEKLQGESSAFGDVKRAKNVIRVLWSKLLPSYLDFHRDLLFHLEPEVIFNGFFLARCAETILHYLGENDSIEDENALVEFVSSPNSTTMSASVRLLSSKTDPANRTPTSSCGLFHSPLTERGISAGPYRELIRRALRCITMAPDNVLRAAAMDPSQIKELCLDPRAYDFDHPVNRRPNYHFGGWDERSIDGDGTLRSFHSAKRHARFADAAGTGGDGSRRG